MSLRTVLLIVTAVSAAVVTILGFEWEWFGIDRNPRQYRGWVGVTAFFFALSFIPWERWSR